MNARWAEQLGHAARPARPARRWVRGYGAANADTAAATTATA